MVHFYDGSRSRALKDVYPHGTWDEWEFKVMESDFWDDIKNQRDYWQWLGEKLGFKNLDNWYNIKMEEIPDKNKSPLKLYGRVGDALKAAYPDHDWKEWMFVEKLPRGFWKDINNQRRFLDWLYIELELNSISDWESVKESEVISRGGSGVLNMYPSKSLQEVLQALYPYHQWSGITTDKDSTQYWDQDKNVRDFLKSIERKLKMVDKEDWYRVSNLHIVYYGGKSLLDKFGGLKEPLSILYPEGSWDPETFAKKNSEMTLHWIKEKVKEILPNCQIKENQILDGVSYSICIPEHNIAIDYKCEQDFINSAVLHEEENKLKYCMATGITYVTIPYWWMGDTDSLEATLHEYRPDLVAKNSDAEPIPNYAPEPRKRRGGRLASKLPKNYLLKATEYRDDIIDPTGWWMSEKLDGVRAYWDGEKLFSKTGNEIFAPDYVKKVLPRFPLDGELWKGKGKFQETCSAVIRRTPEDEKEWNKLWEDVTFNIFDAPAYPGRFEGRLDFAKKIVGTEHPILRIIPMVKCEGKEHLKRELNLISQYEGEGIMLREPNCHYAHGRSKTLLKVKLNLEDEVKLLAKNKETKTLICQARSGEQCVVKCSMWDFENTTEGAVLTVRHNGHYKSGIPKFPYFLRVRSDVSWNEVLEEEL